MKPSYRSTKATSNTWLVRAFTYLFPNVYLSPRYDPVFTDGLTRRYLQTNIRTWRKFSTFEPRNVIHVGVFTDARGGSHLFTSQFHYLENAFCFGEGMGLLPSAKHCYRAFLLRGEFGVNSLQDKFPERIAYLIYNLNSDHWLGSTEWDVNHFTDIDRRWIFHFRNPFRVLLSMDASGKEKWRLSEEAALTILRGFKNRMGQMRRLEQSAPSKVMGVLHEQYVQQPERVFQEVCAFLGIADAVAQRRPTPKAFFRQFMRCGSVPIEHEGRLTSAISGEPIEGWGGSFNPIASMDVARAFMPDIGSTIPRHILALCERELGRNAYDFLLQDHVHRFEGISVSDLARLLLDRTHRGIPQ